MDGEEKRRRMHPADVKRKRTMQNRYGQAQIVAWASKAGQASGKKFTSERAQALNRARWARYYAAHPDKLTKRIEKEKKKEVPNYERRYDINGNY